MKVALDLLDYSSEDSSSEFDAACCCCSDTSGEEICCNWEMSRSGWSMSISYSCLRMMRSLSRRALMRSSPDCCEALPWEGAGALVRAAGGGTGAGAGARADLVPRIVGTPLVAAHLVINMGNGRSCFLVLTGSSFMVATMIPGRKTDIPAMRA
ncbi:hypothetical protein PIB30_078282 [Stylosanthes scabra]|uniref:Uncharacterized protein n=1 Tax=Stylosanthes scabra TaxID=79078 RepID=A0ABU6ZPC9_9FABA|nr:hypothetical protein [Stylosanthes scabra]